MLLFFLLIIFPFPFEIRFFFNVNKNYGITSVWLDKIKINLTKIRLIGNNVLISTKKKKEEQEVVLTSKQIAFFNNFTKLVVGKLSLRKINFYSKIGTFDPMRAAFLGGTVNSFVSILMLKIKQKKPHCEIVVYNQTIFNDAVVMMSCKVRVFISIWDIVGSLLKAKQITKKEMISDGNYA
ncbi:MAG: hypothetical protein RR400_02765 [Clostridia bacterium]